MDLVRCGRCAKQVPDSANYCRRCGCVVDAMWGAPARRRVPLEVRRRLAPDVASWVLAGMVGMLALTWVTLGQSVAEIRAQPFPSSPSSSHVRHADDSHRRAVTAAHVSPAEP
jgi:hypothetical protein